LVALRKTLETAGCKYFENFQVNRGFGRLEPDNTFVTDADKSLLRGENGDDHESNQCGGELRNPVLRRRRSYRRRLTEKARIVIR